MKQRKLLLLMIVFLLSALVLNACTFSVQTLATPPSSEVLATPTFTPPAATQPFATETFTPPASTEILVSPTPTLIPIRADTISMLEVVQSFAMSDIVHSLAFTPDGTALAAAGGNTEDFAIHLWDVVNDKPLGELQGHTNIVWGVAFSPDGKLLASVSADQTAKIWDWREKTLVKSLDFPGQAVSVSFSPDGQNLAVGGVDELEGQIQHAAIWTYSVSSWERLMKFSEYIDIAALAYSPKGGTIIGGGTSRNVQVWRTNDAKPVYTLSHAHQVTRAAISPDGSIVATATCETVVNGDCTEGGVWLWDLPTGRLNQRLAGFRDMVDNVAFSADGSTLVAASRDGTMRFYGTSGFPILFYFTSPGGISALALSPDGGFLATGNVNGDVRIWKVMYRP
jgi:WD40 repeat protein